MFQIELDLQDSQSPVATQEDPSVYFYELHYRENARGLRHQRDQIGGTNPLLLPIGSIIPALLRTVEDRPRPYKTKQAVPVKRLAGLTIAKASIVETNTTAGHLTRKMAAEHIASLVFVQDPDTFYRADYGAESQRRLPQAGIKGLRVHTDEGLKFIDCLHLNVGNSQHQRYPVRYATPTLAARFDDRNGWATLRPMPEETRFVETLVSYENLMDTLDPTV